jgi:hypothetical protein
MATTITTGVNIISPDLILSWESSQESRNIVHTIIGRSNPDVTLKPANLRTGTLELFFTTPEDAFECAALHADAATFLITSDQSWIDGMIYVVTDSIGQILEDTTREYWQVNVPYQEIAA